MFKLYSILSVPTTEEPLFIYVARIINKNEFYGIFLLKESSTDKYRMSFDSFELVTDILAE